MSQFPYSKYYVNKYDNGNDFRINGKSSSDYHESVECSRINGNANNLSSFDYYNNKNVKSVDFDLIRLKSKMVIR